MINFRDHCTYIKMLIKAYLLSYEQFNLSLYSMKRK